jgi:ATP-dependent DNA ligase
MSYTSHYVALARQSAVYVHKVLKGVKPADLPVAFPTKFELTINLKTAKTLGRTALLSLMFRARSATFPGFITPCDPTLRDRAPDGRGWLHEIKIDGYRAQVHIHHARITIYSSSGYN